MSIILILQCLSIHRKKTEPAKPSVAKGSPAENKGTSKKEENGIWDAISRTSGELWDWAENVGSVIKDKMPAFPILNGKNPAEVKVEKKEDKENVFVIEI